MRDIVEKKIEAGAPPLFLYHGSQYDLDIIKPMQASGENEIESQLAIYAAANPAEVIPFALPIRWYPDSPEGRRAFECNGGKTKLIYGSLNPDGVGYIYRLKSDSFERVDEWQWISRKECEYIEKIQIKVREHLDTVEFSEEAKEIQELLYGVK